MNYDLSQMPVAVGFIALLAVIFVGRLGTVLLGRHNQRSVESQSVGR